MNDAKSFALQIDKELADNLDELRQVVRVIALEALRRIVNRTPVDTGRARGNWFVSIGGGGVEVTTDVDPAGGVTVTRGGERIAYYEEVEGFPVITIYNNLPYIERLEDGYSKQAPGGMVAVTVAELQQALA
ncbi:HK97 gp10 family phage protein [Actibacterium sp. MT2.3-13A]|uniref:HK97 gp10 family phage protein n=1 Tax=Actibacterium sp. MT2.3-13A TaxID=2828332 RepID=UPI001BA6EC98|nr:HK97 gp10 family phage protein [Actibacterium sp. MT2.3-13A]